MNHSFTLLSVCSCQLSFLLGLLQGVASGIEKAFIYHNININSAKKGIKWGTVSKIKEGRCVLAVKWVSWSQCKDVKDLVMGKWVVGT